VASLCCAASIGLPLPTAMIATEQTDTKNVARTVWEKWAAVGEPCVR
jgi:hypothetical protein